MGGAAQSDGQEAGSGPTGAYLFLLIGEHGNLRIFYVNSVSPIF
jgi:hypothetical protein